MRGLGNQGSKMRAKVLTVGLLAGSLIFAGEKLVLENPPRSLDKYYPPRSEAFEFLSNMYLMSTAFYGINLNINERNWEKAREWAVKLKDTYVKTSRMVPEWKDYFKPQLAENLVKAVESKSVDRVIESSKKLGQTCAKCHAKTQVAVKLVYHFPSFADISIEDPVEFMEYKTSEYMQKMTNSMKALRIYLMQGEGEKAQEAGFNFVERARQLRSMSSKCHTDKLSEEVIVGKKFEASLSRLEELLSEPAKNSKDIFATLGDVGMSCTRCHNVHLIPALVQKALGR